VYLLRCPRSRALFTPLLSHSLLSHGFVCHSALLVVSFGFFHQHISEWWKLCWWRLHSARPPTQNPLSIHSSSYPPHPFFRPQRRQLAKVALNWNISVLPLLLFISFCFFHFFSLYRRLRFGKVATTKRNSKNSFTWTQNLCAYFAATLFCDLICAWFSSIQFMCIQTYIHISFCRSTPVDISVF